MTMLWLTVSPHCLLIQNAQSQAFNSSDLDCSLKPIEDQPQFESPFKSITQKGNAHLGLGQFDEAKECYESLRTLADNSAADQYLKNLNEAQERD